MNTKHIYTGIFLVGIITLLSILLQNKDSVIIEVLRIIFGSIFILFIPGYVTSKSLFNDNEIDLLERFVLSFTLSISLVPLMSFFINLVGLPINQISIFIIVLSIIILNIIFNSILRKGKIA